MGRPLGSKNVKPALGPQAAQRKWRMVNLDRVRAWDNARYHRNPAPRKELVRKAKLRSRYMLTPEEWDTMNLAQNGLCAICNKPPVNGRRLGVDHNHKTGQVRSLLCDRCNHFLYPLEDIEWLSKAQGYLAHHENGVMVANGKVCNG